MPRYRLFHARSGEGDPGVLDRALEDVWTDPGRAKSQDSKFKHQLEEVMSVIPQEDSIAGPWTEEATYGQDTAMSVAYALRARLNGEAQEAAWAARVAYEALDHFVINCEGIDTNKPGEEQRVLSHPLIQAEFARQRRDLDDLLRASDGGDTTSVVRHLQERAKAEAPVFFGPIS